MVYITPIVTRHDGIEYAEMGAGGGHGDMNQIHELELDDVAAVGSLMELCSEKLQDKPQLLSKVLQWLAKSVKQGGRNVKLDTAAFFDTIYGGNDVEDGDDVPLDRLVTALEKLVQEEKKEVTEPQSRSIVSLPTAASLPCAA